MFRFSGFFEHGRLYENPFLSFLLLLLSTIVFQYFCSSRSVDGYNRAYFNKEVKNKYQIFIYLQNSFPINYFFFSMINSANALETLGEKPASNIEET
jgi:hypothetical protein